MLIVNSYLAVAAYDTKMNSDANPLIRRGIGESNECGRNPGKWVMCHTLMWWLKSQTGTLNPLYSTMAFTVQFKEKQPINEEPAE